MKLCGQFTCCCLKQSRFFEIPVELAKLPNLRNISTKLKTIVDAKWSPTLVFSTVLVTYTSVIWPFTLTAFPSRACFHSANVSNLKDGSTVNIPKFILRNTGMRQQWVQWGWILGRLDKFASSTGIIKNLE